MTLADNEVRLLLFRTGLQSGKLLAAGRIATLCESLDADDMREKLIKIGAKVVTHARRVVFQMAEVAVHGSYSSYLEAIDRLRVPVSSSG